MRCPREGVERRSWVVAVGVVVILWTAVVAQLMVADVWDESSALALFQEYGFAELLSSNWKQAEAGGVVLFRPLPFLVFTGLAAVTQDPEITWRLLRGVNAALVLASCFLLHGAIRRRRGVDPGRDLSFWVLYLFSGSAIITASWFANGFDAMALFFIAFAANQLTRDRGWMAGVALGLAFFCKEVAVLAFPFVAALGWTGDFTSRETKKAMAVAGSLFAVFLVLRTLVVVPGSEADLRRLSFDGVLAAMSNIPVTFWWQVPDVPMRWLGILAFVASVAGLRSWRAAAGVAALYVGTAALYGPVLASGASPLISSGNFAGRLYLVPAALVLSLIGLHGRRHVLLFLLIPVIWGAGITADRHFRFQRAYRALYHVAASAASSPLAVHCDFYDPVFHYRSRHLVIGHLPDARWEFRSDGTLSRRVPHGRRPTEVISTNP